MIEVAESHRANYRKQWLHLSPDLVAALEDLAKAENVTLEALLISLINEALVQRLHRRAV
jgi:hypothetical protein